MPVTHRPLTVVALMLSAFMSAMEMTVVSTAMPTVISDLGGIEIYAWVFTSYIVASTVSMPLFGKAADLYGRKPVMLAGILVFLIGSSASGLSATMTQLIAARIVQGIGAGAMQPISLTIVGDIFSSEERARMQGVFGAVWGVAGMIGPLLGGIIVHTLGWRWVFFVNLPFGLLAGVALAVALHENVAHHHHKLDFAGAGLLAASIVALLLGARGGWWVLGVPLGLVLLVAFVANERRVPEPILAPSLFRSRVLVVSSVAGALIGGAMVGVTTFLPLFVQAVLGGTAYDAGLAVAPMAIGWPIASALGGRLLLRIGYRPLVRLGFILTVAASLAMALLLVPGVSLAVPRWCTALLGLGLGFANTTLLIAVQNSAGWKQRGVATASTLLFRTLGGALSVGVMGAVVAAKLVDSGSPPSAANALLGGRHIDPAVLIPLATALQGGLHTVFWIVVALSMAAFVTGLSFPTMKLERELATRN